MDRVRKIANDFFREQGIKKLPIELDTVIDILKQRGWDVHLYSESEDFIRSKRLEEVRYTKNAFAVHDENIKAVFYDDELGVLDKLEALCHELGHIVLGHTGHGVMGKAKSDTDAIHEKEADAFALEFQAPAYKLYVDKINSVEKIVSAGILSRENAEIQYHESYLKYIAEQIPQMKDTYMSHCEIVYPNRWQRILPFIPLGCSIVVLLFAFGISGWLIGRYGQNVSSVPDTIQTTQPASTITPAPTQRAITETVAPTPEIIVTPAPNPQTAPTGDKITIESLQYDRTMTVYKTKTGTKYHKENCRHLVNRSGIKTLTLETAIAAGMESCDDCFN